MAINVDFTFDFQKALSEAYTDFYQEITDIAKGLDSKCLSTEKAIRRLIEINSSVLIKVLTHYNSELLDEIEV